MENSSALNREEDRPWTARAEYLLLAALVIFFFSTEVFNTDIWWHLATGRFIVEHGSIPAVDPFSYGHAPDLPWMILSWLFAPLAYFIYSAAGIEGLVAAKVFVGGLCCAALVIRSRLEHPANRLLLIAILMIAAFAMRERMMVRPHTVGFLCLACQLLFMDLYLKCSRWWLAALLVNQILWTNIHPSFMLGPVIAGVYLAGHLAQRMSLRTSRRHFTAVLATSFAIVVNPDGIHRSIYTASMFFNEQLHRVEEYGSMALRGHPVHSLLLALAATVLVLCIKQRRFTQAGLIFLFGGLGITSARFFPLLLIVFVPVAPGLLGPYLARFKPRRSLRQRLTAALAIGLAVLATRSSPAWGWRAQPGNYPVAAVDFLERADLLEKIGGNLFNSYLLGGYLIWRLHPKHQVFMDGRIHLYFGSPIETYATVTSDVVEWRELVEAEDIRIAIVNYPIRSTERTLDDTSLLFSGPDWKLVYFDDVAIIYLRTEALYALEQPLRAFRILNPQISGVGYVLAYPREAVLDELEYALKLAPDNYRIHMLRSFVWNRMGNQQAAIDDLKRAIELNPRIENSELLEALESIP